MVYGGFIGFHGQHYPILRNASAESLSFERLLGLHAGQKLKASIGPLACLKATFSCFEASNGQYIPVPYTFAQHGSEQNLCCPASQWQAVAYLAFGFVKIHPAILPPSCTQVNGAKAQNSLGDVQFSSGFAAVDDGTVADLSRQVQVGSTYGIRLSMVFHGYQVGCSVSRHWFPHVSTFQWRSSWFFSFSHLPSS